MKYVVIVSSERNVMNYVQYGRREKMNKICPKCGGKMIRLRNLSYNCEGCEEKDVLKTKYILVCIRCYFVQGDESND